MKRLGRLEVKAGLRWEGTAALPQLSWLSACTPPGDGVDALLGRFVWFPFSAEELALKFPSQPLERWMGGGSLHSPPREKAT